MYTDMMPLDVLKKLYKSFSIRVNDILLVGLPGEPFSEISSKVRELGKQFGFKSVFAVSKANCYGGYLPALWAVEMAGDGMVQFADAPIKSGKAFAELYILEAVEELLNQMQ